MNSRILFVDDEPPIREILTLYFRKKGLTVVTASKSEEARQLAAESPFSLAILDVGLAGENGLDLLSSFKRDYPSMPVIIFTGLGKEELLKAAMAGGAAGFMRKTSSLDSLYQEVCRHLPQS
jgi:two-component system, NtrC family, nitrogen regulation response regulator NtrX